MGKTTEVKVRITGDSKSAEAAAKKTESAYKRLGNTIKRNLVAAMAGATVAVFALVRGFKAVVNAANEQEDAIRALDAALGPLGDSAGEVSKRLQEQAAALQQVTKYGDETIIKGQALVATFTQNEEHIARATEAALNLSAAIGVDLNAAFLLMGKAASGETSTLSRYGIILGEGVAESEKFAAVLGLIEEKMGGRAQEAAKTFSGRIAQLSNALGDVAERLGETVTKNDEAGDAISRLTGFVQANETALATWVSGVGAVFAGLIGGIADKATQLGTAIGAVTAKVLEWSGAFGEVEARSEALVGVASRLGITVAELEARMDAAAHGIHTVNTETEKASDGMENLANKTDKAGNAAEELADNFKTATEAAIGLGNALGEVTSIELALEIEKITEALVESTATMDKNGAEYERLERIAVMKIERIRERIRNLRDGLGDLQETTKSSVDSFVSYAGGMDTASAATQRFISVTSAANASVGQFRGDFARQSAQRRAGTSSFSQISGGTFTFQSPTRLTNFVTQDADGRLRVA